MADNFDFEAEVISGLIDRPSRRSLEISRVPELPIDSGIFDAEPMTGAADELIAETEDADFASAVTGLSPAEYRKAVTPGAGEPLMLAKSMPTNDQRAKELNDRMEILIRGVVRRELVPIVAETTVAKRKSELLKKSPQWRRAIERMQVPLRNLFRHPPDARFDRLTDEMVNFLQAQIIAQA
jgi:hypothetical protein